MTDYLKLGLEIAHREMARPKTAFERLSQAVQNGDDRLTLCDRDLVVAAREAVRRGEPSTATVALDELALRMVIDQPLEQIERAA